MSFEILQINLARYFFCWITENLCSDSHRDASLVTHSWPYIKQKYTYKNQKLIFWVYLGNIANMTSCVN